MLFNPVKTTWFPLAITDEVLLHTVLFASVVHISFVSGCRSSEESDVIMEPIFRQLGRRLQDYTKLSDATIGAVSCLAMVEVGHRKVRSERQLA